MSNHKYSMAAPVVSVHERPVLLVLSGPSGAGKTSLCTELLRRIEQLEVSVSYTTRAPRGKERDGVDYHFVTDAAFDALVAEDQFAEWATVHDHRYGTTRAAVDSRLMSGYSVLFDIDYQGAANLVRAYPDAVTVMVLPPDMETLEFRLRARGTDADEVVRRRMKKAVHEIQQASSFQYVVVNETFDDALQRLESIYRAAQSRAAGVWPLVSTRSLRAEFENSLSIVGLWCAKSFRERVDAVRKGADN